MKDASKKIFVLANSVKKRQRCVAGREVIKESDGVEYWGEWIRPVTLHDEGAINPLECRLQDGTNLVLFDIIQVPLTSNENSPTQPENWYIQKGAQWRKISTGSRAEAWDLVEAPKNLWLEAGVKQDRVTPEYLLSQKSHRSLYLIQPVNFRFFVEMNYLNNKTVRGLFKYNEYIYDFSMTDPLVRQKYFPDFPNVPLGTKVLEQKNDLLICVSLTPVWNGYHYKIIASVIEE